MVFRWLNEKTAYFLFTLFLAAVSLNDTFDLDL